MVLDFIFRFVIQHKLIFIHGVRQRLRFIFFHMSIHLFSNICLKDFPFPIGLTWYFGQKSIDYLWVGLYLESLEIIF